MSNTSDPLSQNDALFDYVLRLGDSNLILAQRLCEWSARAPTLEQDVALLNVSLDLIGQARSLLSYAGQVEGAGRDEDRLAYHRDAQEWRNPLLVELPNGDFAETMTRQFLYDAFNFELYQALIHSRDGSLSAIAAKAVKEVAYHSRHSSSWVIRLGDGTDESHRRMQQAIDKLWPYTGELFEPTETDAALLQSGVAADLTALTAGWSAAVDQVLRQATLKRPADGWMQRGGKIGVHTEHLSYLLAEMQVLPRANPSASW